MTQNGNHCRFQPEKPMHLIPDSPLADLAAKIKKNHEEITLHGHKLYQRIREQGKLLIEAKNKCHHGQWDKFLIENCEIAPRTARAYMQIATARPLTQDEVGDMTMNEILKKYIAK